MTKSNGVATRLGGDPHISQEQGYAPFRMGFKQAAGDSLDVYLYGHIEPSYYDYWEGVEVEGNSSDYFKRILFDENPHAKQINLFINSGGGDVFEGTAMANMLRRHPAKVTAVIDGFACSIASVIAMAADDVYMPNNASMMIHNMWTWTVGNALELRKMADDLDKLMEANRTIYLDKAGDKLTEEELIAMLDAETWLTAKECVDLGFCDELMADVELEEATVADMETTVAQRLDHIKAMQKATKAVLGEAGVEDEVDQAADEGESKQETKKTYLQTFFKEKEN